MSYFQRTRTGNLRVIITGVLEWIVGVIWRKPVLTHAVSILTLDVDDGFGEFGEKL